MFIQENPPVWLTYIVEYILEVCLHIFLITIRLNSLEKWQILRIKLSSWIKFYWTSIVVKNTKLFSFLLSHFKNSVLPHLPPTSRKNIFSKYRQWIAHVISVDLAVMLYLQIYHLQSKKRFFVFKVCLKVLLLHFLLFIVQFFTLQ